MRPYSKVLAIFFTAVKLNVRTFAIQFYHGKTEEMKYKLSAFW